MDYISIIFQATLSVQLLSNVAAQYPMQYPGPQMAPQMQMPQMSQMSQMPQMPHMPQMPYSMPMPMPGPMPMPIAMPHNRLPVVVMPFRGKDMKKQKKQKKQKKHRHKKKRKYKPLPISSGSSSGSSSDTDTDCSDEVGFSSGRRSRQSRRHHVLTPVISYVTKDGYVVYQKKIKKERAKDWLELGKKKTWSLSSGEATINSEEMTASRKKRRRS